MLGFLLELLSFKTCLLALLLAPAIVLPLLRWKASRQIAQLGGRAPILKLWAPLGLDFVYRAVQAYRSRRVLDFEQWVYKQSGGAAKGNYNAEMTIMGTARVMFSADPENIKAILATQFHDYGKGEHFHRLWSEFVGDGIFTTDGAQWHDARQLLRPMFVRERVGDLDLFETHVQKLIALLGPGDGREVRVDQLISRFTVDAATEYLFGTSVGSLESGSSTFASAFDQISSYMALRARAGIFSFLQDSAKFEKNLSIVEDFIEQYIVQALALTPDQLEQKVSKSDTFVDALARYTRDRKVLRDQLISILLAGRDSTASTLSWILLELSRNPRVVRKLQEEIKSHLGPNGRPPTYQDIKDFKYVTYIINETLRLYPALPMNVRFSLVDTTLPRGAGPDGLDPIGIKALTPIGYSPLVMHRRRDLYPPISESFPFDPLDWAPDRWATWTPKPWHYVPFNGGPRICIGQNFAMTEMAYVLIRLFQAFESMIDYGNEPVLKAEIVLTPGNGVKVGFVRHLPGQAVRSEKLGL